jgi:RHS repeat-associated protein
MGGQYEVKDGAVKKYYSIAGMMVATQDASGLQYLLTDHLGSTVAVTNSSGTLTSQQRYLPFGAARSIPNSPIVGTDFTYTGQRLLDSGMGGIMDYKARFYSPYLNQFTQPDTIVSNPNNPQTWNRYAYVLNNPIRYNDPTGHVCSDPEDPTPTCYGTGTTRVGNRMVRGNGAKPGSANDTPSGRDDRREDSDCQEGDICFDLSLRNDCGDQGCRVFATGLGILGTSLDISAFILNLSFAAAADIAFIFGGPLAYLEAVALYKLASPIPNIIGTYGGVMWGLQGILLGNTHLDFSGTLSSNFWSNNATLSLTFSQDTAVSAINDGLGWIIPEPNLAAASSLAGVEYDLGRNPLAPLSPAPPLIPTFIAPTYSVSYDFSSLPPISRGWSLFPPSP